jgi:D-serine deaminase-like pyridoxal phosphate-dependent protein
MIAMKEQRPWYYIHQIEKIDSPTLVIYLDRVRKNIDLVKSMIDDITRLRPHVKTHKTREATLLLMEAGVRKFKCATISEAEMLGSCEAPDVLLAYQPTGPKVERLIQLIKKFPSTRFSCLVDSLAPAQFLAVQAQIHQLEIPVYIDLNVGMNRTGVVPSKAKMLFEQIVSLQGIIPVGLHVYDGHIADTDINQRTNRCNEAFAPVEELKEQLAQAGYDQLTVIAGGSPTFPVHAQRGEVECSPGTFIYWDAGYQETLQEQSFLPAALVISRVISQPSDHLLCTDLGHKSIAAENPLNRRVRFINAPDLEVLGQSEEHLIVKNTGDQEYAIGDILYGMPIHICPTCALYDRALVIENGEVITEWKMVSRDRKITV